jgi:hypothetical protein
MKNKLLSYANLIKTNFVENGCTFIMQKADVVSESIILQFHHNTVLEITLHSILEHQKCSYRMEYGKDIVIVLLFKEI